MQLCNHIYKISHKMFIICPKLKIYKFFDRINRILCSCDIPGSCKIGKNVEFFHSGLGVVIATNTHIGDNCKIFTNVTIGHRGDGKGSPYIGDNVFIGAGACVLGGVKIGNNVNIGANAVVLKDIPSNCTVVGIPAKILKES